MTNSSIATLKGGNWAATSPRTANTLRLNLLMEAQHKLEIARRITDLRERSPYTQPEIAEKLGITLRAYQKVEQKGTESIERCEELFEIHRGWAAKDSEWRHISSGWIWDGKVREGDLFGGLSELEPTEVDEVLELRAQVTKLLADVAGLQAGEVELRSRVERLEP